MPRDPLPPAEHGESFARRDFLKVSAALAATFPAPLRGAALPAPLQAATAFPQAPLVDGYRLNAILDVFRRYGGGDDGGTTRLAYSDQDIAVRAYAASVMESAGLQVSVDIAGNLIGRRDGADPAALPIIIGSHLDTVPEGGSYDGMVGCAAAFEVALTLHHHEVELGHPLEVVVFQNEEGGKTGSRALVGQGRAV